MSTIKYLTNDGVEFCGDEMLPCPFCGGQPIITFIGNNHTKKRKVEIKCKSCRVQRTNAAIYNDLQSLAELSINQWNKRICQSKNNEQSDEIDPI